MSDGEAEDGRNSKKRKASRACDRCNSQHQPCDNAIPKCSVCERAGSDCTYDRPVRKRGPRTGYTAQYGERLWGLVLQANPAIEDTILQILSDRAHHDAATTNADYFKDNAHQTELVNHFNSSRLGKFVQTGQLPELDPVPRGEAPLPSSRQRSEQTILQPSSGQGSVQESASPQFGGPRSRRATLSGHARRDSIVNPHGPPQNPGDIYTLSDDVRKLGSSPGHGQGRLNGTGPTGQSLASGSAWQPIQSPAVSTPAYDRSVFEDSQDGTPIYHCPMPVPSRPHPPTPQVTQRSTHTPTAERTEAEIEPDFPDPIQWYDSIPTDTLLNLGFAGGEGMAEDFFAICENPDPVDMASLSPGQQTEDEETVWRRLVMRGRFV